MSRKEALIEQARRDIQRHWDSMPYHEKRMCVNFRDWYVRTHERREVKNAQSEG